MADTPRPAPVSFPEFQPVSTEAWQERIRRDLKGADPAALLWHTSEGFDVQPFYHQEALETLGDLPSPLLPEPAAPDRPWRNVPVVRVAPQNSGHEAVDQARISLDRGADGVHFIFTDDASAFDVDYLHSFLPLETTFIGYSVPHHPGSLLGRLLAASKELGGFLLTDPLTHHHNSEFASHLSELRSIIKLTQHLPKFKALTVDASFFGNRGGTNTQQIGYALNVAAAYLQTLPNADLSVADVATAMQLHLAIGTSYFLEIAKLRAVRQLWATLLHAFNLPPSLATTLRIHTSTSSWLQTTLDPHTNLLRFTTEAMAAILGGATSLTVAPFDSLYREPGEFSERLARNLSIILREESQLGRVLDPAAGSYYLETLTDTLAREAWALFQATEAKGGLPKAWGGVLEELRIVSRQQFHRIATGEQVIVGTNRFRQAEEEFEFDPKKLLRSRSFDTTRAAYPTEVLRLVTAMHFRRQLQQNQRAAVVLLGQDANRAILESFLKTLPQEERASLPLPEPAADTLSVLFSTPETVTLMYATVEQYHALAREVSAPDTADLSIHRPTLLSRDVATMQAAVERHGLQELSVNTYKTDDILARLQGKT
jgi:methylmalonyl-CoA mutase